MAVEDCEDGEAWDELQNVCYDPDTEDDGDGGEDPDA